MADVCLHCGQKSQTDFCCVGCEGAYGLIHRLGLESYYHNKLLNAEERPLIPEETLYTDIDRFVQQEDGISSIYLMVEGLHCAACVWLIESVLSKEKGVTYARVNMTTRRLELKWDPQKTQETHLISVVQKLGYKLYPYDPTLLENKDKKYEKHLLMCLAIAGFSAANVMLFSVSIWSGVEAGSATALMFQWLSALIALPAVAFSARPFFTSAFSALKSRHVNMDVPISLAIVTALSMSMYDTVFSARETYFESAIMLTFFLLIGRYFDFKMRMKGRSSAERLLSLQASSATVKRGDTACIVPVEQLKKGDLLLVAQGENFAADGIVLEGESYVDNSSFTGEKLPQNVAPKSEVVCGAINLGQSLTVQVTAVGKETLLSHIVKLMEKAAQYKNKYIKLSDKVSSSYAPVVHTLAAVTFLFWWFLGVGVHDALTIAVTVLIVTCPCALALAIPTVHTVVGNILLKKGVILRTPEALERIKEVDMVVFDKTGTLTTGELKIVSEHKEEVLQKAASLCVHSLHPISKAIVTANSGRGLQAVQDVKEYAGKGIEGELNQKVMRVGKREFCGLKKEKQKNSNIEVWFDDGQEKHKFEFEDQIRTGVETLFKQLEKRGVNNFILSGDSKENVQQISQNFGGVPYEAECSPERKYDFLKEQSKSGQKVMMVGDGINDALALSFAHVSISFAQGSAIAQNAADVIFQRDDLTDLNMLFDLSKISHGKMVKNLALSLCYNACAVPLAMAGFITPLIAAILMSSSSVLVMLNSLHLIRKV